MVSELAFPLFLDEECAVVEGFALGFAFFESLLERAEVRRGYASSKSLSLESLRLRDCFKAS